MKIDLYGRHLLWLRTPEDVARAVLEAGYDGIDVTVRPGPQGHVDPARVGQDLAPFVRGVRALGVSVTAITAPIADADSPNAEAILQAASALDIRHYWWGTWRYAAGRPVVQQLDELRPRVATLAGLSAKYGMTAMYHTFAGNAVGASIWDLLSVLKDFDSAHVGLHYDVGHMVKDGTNGSWATDLRMAGRYIAGVSVKDSQWTRASGGQWRSEFVPLGEGIVPLAQVAQVLKEIGFAGPMENQPEYPEGMGGRTDLNVPRERFMQLVRQDQQRLRQVLTAAGL